jgi:hypothetical protein
MDSLRFCARGASAALALLAPAMIGAGAYGQRAPDISGTYWATEYSAKIRPIERDELPFTTDGKAAYEMNMAGLKDGSITDIARKYCVADGLPRLLATPYPFEILQAPPGQITMVYELNHQIRAIAMGKPLPPRDQMAALPLYNGHSVGHFEGDVLVIQSAGFNGGTFLDATGAPHTDELATTELVHKINPTELEDVITVHDPDYYSEDWQARFVYTLRNDVRLEDYVCGEQHRDLSSVKGVRRP